jgi:hypothetical protein
MPIRENPSHAQWKPEKGVAPMPGGLDRGNPNQGHWNTMQGVIPNQGMSSNYVNSSPMQNNAQTPYTSEGYPGFYQNPGQQEKISWQPGASQNPGSSFPLNPPLPRLPFPTTLYFLYFSRC